MLVQQLRLPRVCVNAIELGLQASGMTAGKYGPDQKAGAYLSLLLSASAHVMIYFTSDLPDLDFLMVNSRTAGRPGDKTDIVAAGLYPSGNLMNGQML